MAPCGEGQAVEFEIDVVKGANGVEKRTAKDVSLPVNVCALAWTNEGGRSLYERVRFSAAGRLQPRRASDACAFPGMQPGHRALPA